MGESTCPGITGTEEVYSSITSGSDRTQSGGGSNHLCMPKVPEYTHPFSSSELTYKTFIYGAEYQYPLQGSHNLNVPCAVCHVSTRSAVLMIPGNTTCPTTWTREYYGGCKVYVISFLYSKCSTFQAACVCGQSYASIFFPYFF